MKKISFLMAGALCLMSCNNETNIPDPETDSDEGRITLELADATVMTYSTADKSECTIDRLWVLEFNGEDLVHDTLILGAQIQGNGTATQMLPQLPFKPTNGNRIVILGFRAINNPYLDIQFPHPNRSSIKYSTINTYFPIKQNPFYLRGGMSSYMSGEIASWPGAYTCEMTRPMAKIQVQLGENFSDVTGNFNTENVSWDAWHIVQGVYIRPVIPYHNSYAPPNRHGTDHEFGLLQKENLPALDATCYIVEFPYSNTSTEDYSSISDDVFDCYRACILIKKEVAGVDTTFYRLDFYDPDTKKFIDVKRNHHYIFTINRVGSEGYAAYTYTGTNQFLEYGASYNPGSNIEYTVEIRDGARHITSNGQYAIASSVDTAYVAAPATDATVCTARYQLPPEITALGEYTSNSITLTDVIPDGSVELVFPLPTYMPYSPLACRLTTTNAPIKVTTTAAFQSARIKMNVGNITHYVVLKKR
jgi:hypothetical protein